MDPTPMGPIRHLFPLKEAKMPPLVDYFVPLAGMDRVFALNGTGSSY